jgi:hypothetical protein
LLEESDTFVHHLSVAAEREFGPGRLAFLNGGKGGWGTADYLAFLEEYGEEIAPRVVVVFLNYADLRRSASTGLYRLTDPGRLELEACRKPVSRMAHLRQSPLYNWFLGNCHTFQLGRRALAVARERSRARRAAAPRLSLPSPPDRGETAPVVLLGQALFRRLHRWCQGHGATLLVLTTGYQARYHQPADPDVGDEVAFLRGASAFFAREGIPFRDLTPDLRPAVASPDETFVIPGDGHPNAAGARLIATHAWPWLAPRLAPLVSSRGPSPAGLDR